jgi:hypothetical protein
MQRTIHNMMSMVKFLVANDERDPCRQPIDGSLELGEMRVFAR